MRGGCYCCAGKSRVFVCQTDRLTAKPFTRGLEPCCPRCRKPMLKMGMGFRTPRRRDKKAWDRLERRLGPEMAAGVIQ